MGNNSLQIGVIGQGGAVPEDIGKVAYDVGKKIALEGHNLVCGGHGGIMEYAAKGAKEHGGLTVGIIMSYNKKDANPYIDVCIRTGLSHARNTLVVASSDAIIAIAGGVGTLSEIALALKMKIPIAGIESWTGYSKHFGQLDVSTVENPIRAVELAINMARGAKNVK